jgi:apolipoprotein N-acyltransferase
LWILALPDAGLWPLAFVAYLPLFLAVAGLSRRRAFFTGWLAGLVLFSGIFHWIVHTAMTMSDFPAFGAVPVLLAFAAWSGLGTALVALACRELWDRPLRVLTVPAAVVGVEFLWPLLFPVGLGNAFYRVPALMQGMDSTGVYGGTFVAVAVTVGAASVIRELRAGRPWPRGTVVATVAILAAWLGYGLVRLLVLPPEGEPGVVRLAIVQPDITAEDKKHRDGASRKALFERIKGLTLGADTSDVDAVVWPEGAFSFFFDPFAEGRKGWENITETSKRLVAMVGELKKPLVFGSLTEPAGRSRNSLILLGPDGAERQRYDKRKLLAFGEYMPLSNVFPFLRESVKEVSDMEPGNRPVAFEFGPARALASICYEAILPTFTREAAEETGANLLLNVTNDAWFGTSGAPEQHLMVQVPRSVELRLPLVRSTETGISAVVDARGEFTFETGLHERRVDRVTVPLGGAFSLYRVVGDAFAWICLAGVVASLGVGYWRGKKSRSTKIG